MKQQRTIVWFSCGAASAVAAKLALKEDPTVLLVYCDPGGEHPDNKRFLKDCEKWFRKAVIILRNEKYTDHYDVCLKERYLVGPGGARCTLELKKRPRQRFQKPDDIHIMGFTLEEQSRANDFSNRNPELFTRWILIEHGLGKQDCLGIVWKAGIKIPAMYNLGYNHNNCIGCVKGGMGYWNKIRIDFPEHFTRMCIVERELNRTVLNGPFLDELDPQRGNFRKEPPITCGLGCGLAGV